MFVNPECFNKLGVLNRIKGKITILVFQRDLCTTGTNITFRTITYHAWQEVNDFFLPNIIVDLCEITYARKASIAYHGFNDLKTFTYYCIVCIFLGIWVIYYKKCVCCSENQLANYAGK